MTSVEIFRGKQASPTANHILKAMAAAIRSVGDNVVETTAYAGDSEWLLLFGVGAEAHNMARNQHCQSGRHTLMFDLGYWQRDKIVGYCRMSIDSDHCWPWLDKTSNDVARWRSLGVQIANNYKVDGPIILIGLGRKSRTYLREPVWEVREYRNLKKRFPDHEIIFRPKPGHPAPSLPCRVNDTVPIAKLLRGASLVVCRHSNCAVDAVVAGVPFEAIDGAAMWLVGKPYDTTNRLDFLHRLAHWQYCSTEAVLAWNFAKAIVHV